MEETKRYRVRLVSSRPEKSDIRTFEFAGEEVPFRAGQYVHLKLLGMESDNVHEFSISSAPGENVAFTTRVREESPYKQFLASMKPGDEAEIFKIKGDLTIPEPLQPIVFIAQGIGITPVRSVFRDAARRNVPLQAILVHVARAPHLFEEELAALPHQQYRIGRPEIDETLNQVAATQPQSLYYVVGSPEFVVNIAEKLQSRNIAEAQIKTDDWGY